MNSRYPYLTSKITADPAQRNPVQKKKKTKYENVKILQVIFFVLFDSYNVEVLESYRYFKVCFYLWYCYNYVIPNVSCISKGVGIATFS